ncbi:GFA family protein [Caulobacter sp. 73W]|uniref:GFA family protein n=1 Tax=Caulobacter sp. 73W TaxID=3161137 RepID=A0AB39KY97_9CAUL
MLKTYSGSCHCGRVAFEVAMDFQGASKCNCRYCWKQRNWNVQVDPASFQLIRGEEHLGDYARKGDGFETHHRFCRECGTATHGHGSIDAMGGAYAGVRIAALDDLSVEELLAKPTTYCDGLNDNWWNSPDEVRHL